MRASISALAAFVVVTGAAPAVGAQVVDRAAILEPGRRVRVTAVRAPSVFRPPYREGVLARLDADSIRFVDGRGDTVAVARADIGRLEVLVRVGGTRRRLMLGAVVGAVGGGTLGVALGGSAGGCGDLPGCTSSVDTGGSFAAGAAIGGAIGLFVAALTGDHRWRIVKDF